MTDTGLCDSSRKPGVSVLLIDDHPLTRCGIGDWLRGTGRFSIAGEAATLAQARSLLETLASLPALVILDISLGQENGLSCIAAIQEAAQARNEKTPAMLVCSMYDDPFLARTAMESGADGYISKSASPQELLAAVDTVLAGEQYIDKNLESRSGNKAYAELTRREWEILTLLKRSLNNRQIAEAMHVSLRTVENHLSHIYLKTGVSSRRGLVDL
jgi:NarL family two-component system response regulator LiaR